MKYLGPCTPAMVAMIYNWETLQWTEYTEVASVHEVSQTVEMTCAKVIHEEQTKIYVMMNRYMDQLRLV